jgi:molybdate transport system substrate-binding protein
MLKQLLLTIAIVIGIGSAITHADENAQKDAPQVEALNLAVAADFAPTAESLGKEFTTLTGIAVKITSDSSGALLQMIKKGSQFDVYMSANTHYPVILQKEGYTDGSPLIYAIGSLALYAKGKELTHSGLDLLQPGGFSKLAVANPKGSPYGVAAKETLKKLGIYEQVQSQLVYADNIAKALEMVESGQVEAGLVSYGDLSDEQKSKAWIVPGRMHNPIKQSQVALKGGNAAAAQKWIKFVESDTAKNVLMSSGYGVTNVEEVKE